MQLGAGLWVQVLFLIITAVSLLLMLWRELPFQNVVLASVVIVSASWALEALLRAMHVSANPAIQGGSIGLSPLVWPCALLTARGIARLLLQRNRESQFYGIYLIGVAALLSAQIVWEVNLYGVLLNLSLEIDLTIFQPFSLAGLCFQIATALLALVCATPALINKKPLEAPPMYEPLIVWLAFNCLFISAAWLHGLRFISVVICLENLGLLTLVVISRLLSRSERSLALFVSPVPASQHESRSERTA